jgi:hypothetical protein
MFRALAGHAKTSSIEAIAMSLNIISLLLLRQSRRQTMKKIPQCKLQKLASPRNCQRSGISGEDQLSCAVMPGAESATDARSCILSETPATTCSFHTRTTAQHPARQGRQGSLDVTMVEPRSWPGLTSQSAISRRSARAAHSQVSSTCTSTPAGRQSSAR